MNRLIVILGLAVSLPSLAAEVAADPRRKRHCILLWMSGGPSHIDTFDMKPGHNNGGELKEIATRAPGLRFSEHLPKLAEHGERIAVVRSLVSVWEQYRPARDETLIDQSRRRVELHVPDGQPDILQQVEHGVLQLVAQFDAVGHAIPAIAVTADHSAKVQSEVRRDGIAYLRKPIKTRELFALIHKVIAP